MSAPLPTIDHVAATIADLGRAQGSPWVPARTVCLHAGLSRASVGRAADALTAAHRIRRRWIATQWWYCPADDGETA